MIGGLLSWAWRFPAPCAVHVLYNRRDSSTMGSVMVYGTHNPEQGRLPGWASHYHKLFKSQEFSLAAHGKEIRDLKHKKDTTHYSRLED